MTTKKPDQTFSPAVSGYVDPDKGVPEMLRLTSVLKTLRDQGAGAAADEVAALADRVGRRCDTHGYLEDPLVFTVGNDQLAFGCPDCSGKAIRDAYDKEGGPQA